MVDATGAPRAAPRRTECGTDPKGVRVDAKGATHRAVGGVGEDGTGGTGERGGQSPRAHAGVGVKGGGGCYHDAAGGVADDGGVSWSGAREVGQGSLVKGLELGLRKPKPDMPLLYTSNVGNSAQANHT
eukprot:1178832-Prorocentrum_minimum.AAC.1